MSTERINQSICTIFRATRKFHGLRQAEFATILGITQGTVSKIEAGIMHPELILWFRFLRLFKITNSSCFTQDGAEFNQEVFRNIIHTGSPLLTKFSFTPGNEIFNVRRIRPFFDILINSHPKEFETFLKKNQVDIGLFYILNHPVTFEFADTFFSFLKERNITEKSMSFLDFKFNFNNAEQIETPTDLHSIESLFTNISESEDSFVNYELDTASKAYTVSLKRDHHMNLKSLANKEFIMNYNLLYPFYFLTANKEYNPTKPVINEIQANSEWTISYAG